MQKQREVRDLKENFQREVLTATQHHLDREMELQKFCQKEKDAHFKSIEVKKMVVFCWCLNSSQSCSLLLIQSGFDHVRLIISNSVCQVFFKKKNLDIQIFFLRNLIRSSILFYFFHEQSLANSTVRI